MSKQKYNKIVMINPPGKVFLNKDGMPAHRKHCFPPIGIAYLAASAIKRGYDVKIIDCIAEGYQNEVAKDNAIIYGLPIDDIINKINNLSPDIVGISVMFSFMKNEITEICKKIKSKFNIPIVLGGCHPSAEPEITLKSMPVEYIMIGEVDEYFSDLLDAINNIKNINNIPSLYYKKMIKSIIQWNL